ncbi:MAG: hypothetical protein JST11_16840 [Acidobacteria bacterium]|nr:hypothetical protein [Acidobacteriota bacterium]
MYDFWFTLGVAIMQSDFFGTVSAPPDFNHIVRLTVETDTSVTPPKIEKFENTISAGKLDSNGAPKFRAALNKQLKTLAAAGMIPPPPPTSVYAAGRLSQLLLVPELGFSGEQGFFAVAHEAFSSAVADTNANVSTFPATFPAFLGLCLIDGGLRALLRNDGRIDRVMLTKELEVANRPDGPIVDDLGELLDEFGISRDANSPERKVLTGFLNGTEGVVQDMVRRNGNPWQFGCPDWLVYWSPQSDRAVS